MKIIKIRAVLLSKEVKYILSNIKINKIINNMVKIVKLKV